MDKLEQDSGKMDLMGLEVDIAKFLGENLADQYVSSLSKENMKELMTYITADLFVTERDGSTRVRADKEDVGPYSAYYSKRSEDTLANKVRSAFNEKVKEVLYDKVEALLSTPEFEKKTDEIAQYIVDYASEGYKEDMVKSIKQRMIGDVLSQEPYYGDGNIGLREIIRQEISRTISYS